MTCVGYDNDKVCIDNPCNFIYGESCKIKTIDFNDSPYNTLIDDVEILIDASLGNITINLINHPDNPTQHYVFKRIDSSSNTITLVPAVGHTINNMPTYTLPRVTEVVSLCHNGTNWEVTNDKLDRVLTTKGDLYAHDGTKVVRFPVGSNGQILTADSSSSSGLTWFTLPTGARMSYQILSNRTVASKVAYTPIAYFPWSNSEHGAFTGGKVVFRATYGNRALNVRLIDVTNGPTVLGSMINIAATGTYSFTIINPTADAQVELQIGTESQGGIKPEVLGAVLEFINM